MEHSSDALQILQTESEHGRLEMVMRPPASRLRGLVGRYCLYDEARSLVTAHQHLPHPDITFIISLGGALEVRDPSGEIRIFREGEGFLAGIHTRPAVTNSGPRQRGVEVSLSPLAAHLLLGGLPMHSVSERTVALEDLIGRSSLELAGRLAETRGRAEPFDVLDAFFAEGILAGFREEHAPVQEAWQLLESSGGTVRIGAIGARLGWSRKRLVAAFRERIGHPPKTIARVLRFDRAMSLLKQSPRRRWSDVALSCGYHDQAHLVREVRELSGSTPNQLARLVLPDSGAMTAS